MKFVSCLFISSIFVVVEIWSLLLATGDVYLIIHLSVSLSLSTLNILISRATHCRYHAYSILISLPNGGAIFIFFHWMIGRMGSKIVRVGRILNILDVVKMRMTRKLDVLNATGRLLKTKLSMMRKSLKVERNHVTSV